MPDFGATDFYREILANVSSDWFVGCTGCLRDRFAVAQPLVTKLGALGPGARLGGEGVADFRSALDRWGGSCQRGTKNFSAFYRGTCDLMGEAIGDLTGDPYGDLLAVVRSLQRVARRGCPGDRAAIAQPLIRQLGTCRPV